MCERESESVCVIFRHRNLTIMDFMSMDVEYLRLKDGRALMEKPEIVGILHAHQIYTEADFMQHDTKWFLMFISKLTRASPSLSLRYS